MLREDGKIYIVTGDTICLKTPRGKYVDPLSLKRIRNQKWAKLIAEMSLEEAPSLRAQSVARPSLHPTSVVGPGIDPGTFRFSGGRSTD